MHFKGNKRTILRSESMTLQQCTKKELLYIFEQLPQRYMFKLDYYINSILSDIEYQRETKKIDEAGKFADIAFSKRKEYAQLLKPYEGKKFADVPMDILKKADSLMKEVQKADKEYRKLMDMQ